ncbi:MAG: glycoside hydrolase family 2 TIM barrel-domain containing protein [Pirellulales bacterium]|nr:glycoside hydrolase family 2 TIM barrel-domain containing protein [Pirellulales bacterium]
MSPESLTVEPHPRPLLERAGWISLSGTWDFAIDADGVWRTPQQASWPSAIRVPFAPETVASGVHHTGLFRACWYRRRFRVPPLPRASRLILHFGAVDYSAEVWINNKLAVRHEGGHTPFGVDITELLEGEEQTVVVRAEDDPNDLAKPRGKQDWQLHPHSIWYPRTTGIWQGVWLEVVPAVFISTLRWTPNIERWEIGMEARIGGALSSDTYLTVKLWSANTIIAEDRYHLLGNELMRRIALSDPGIDDYRNELLWSPARPTLIQARLNLENGAGETLDSVHSYTALRSIAIQGDRFVLNGRPYPLRMVLDQGYWPDTGLTPPHDQALRRDIQLIKAMGFNGVRKHQKIECPGFLYWADVLGLLVWEEMPSAYRFTKLSIERLTREWIEVIERDSSHPCIVAWMPFNESWGVPDLPDSPTQRHYVQALYHLTKTLDPTRPVIGNDGWESVATDIIGIHDYDHDPERIAHRYGAETLPRLLKRERPGGRILLLGSHATDDQPIMLTEFGGIAFSPDPARTWGYTRADTAEQFATDYANLLEAVRSSTTLAGFCYTQFTDTYQEANGLLYADRTPKIPIELIREATRGGQPLPEPIEWEWRERLMSAQRTQYLIPSEDYRTHRDR